MFKEINSLKLFFEEPQREFHLRELSRIIKKNPVTIKKNLFEFVKIGILSRRKERGLEIYSSNTENFYYKEIKKIHNRFKIIDSGLLDFLKNEFNLPTIFLFGSFQRGEDNKNSDVDILVEVSKETTLFDLIDIKSELEKVLKKKVDLVEYKGIKSALRDSILSSQLPIYQSN